MNKISRIFTPATLATLFIGACLLFLIPSSVNGAGGAGGDAGMNGSGSTGSGGSSSSGSNGGGTSYQGPLTGATINTSDDPIGALIDAGGQTYLGGCQGSASGGGGGCGGDSTNNSSGGGSGGGGGGGGSYTPPQCSDGRDNDGDGKVDYNGYSVSTQSCSGNRFSGNYQCTTNTTTYAKDPGCDSPSDNSEIDTPPTSSCDLSRLSFWERLQVTLSGRCNTTTPPPPPTPPTPTYSISGTVFNDLNGNHVRDTGEPGTKGTQTSISLYRNANDSIPIGGLSVQAQTNGTYTVGSVPAGSYYIRGQTSPPYILTYPSNAQHYRTVSANIANLNFGIALSSCPTGFILQGSSCVAEVPTTCPALCNGSNLVNSCTGALVQSCSYGCTLNTNACNAPPPPPSVVTWSVLPLLVKSGKSAHVTWDTTNTVSCTVRGTNGDGTGNNSTGLWNSTSGSAATSPILSQTIYTLSCQGRLGSSPSTITRSTTVNIVPIFNEQ